MKHHNSQRSSHRVHKRSSQQPTSHNGSRNGSMYKRSNTENWNDKLKAKKSIVDKIVAQN